MVKALVDRVVLVVTAAVAALVVITVVILDITVVGTVCKVAQVENTAAEVEWAVFITRLVHQEEMVDKGLYE